jgi:hypothetical protein
MSLPDSAHGDRAAITVGMLTTPLREIVHSSHCLVTSVTDSRKRHRQKSRNRCTPSPKGQQLSLSPTLRWRKVFRPLLLFLGPTLNQSGFFFF